MDILVPKNHKNSIDIIKARIDKKVTDDLSAKIPSRRCGTKIGATDVVIAPRPAIALSIGVRKLDSLSFTGSFLPLAHQLVLRHELLAQIIDS